MKNTKLLLALLFLVICKPVYANDLFYDNFDSSVSLNNWTHSSNIGDPGSWIVKEDGLHSFASRNTSSFLCLKNIDLPLNYFFESKVKNISGVDQQLVFRSNLQRSNYYLVDYRYNDSDWSWDNNNVKLYKIFPGGNELLGTYPGDIYPRKIDITQGQEHVVKVSLYENNIKVFFDDEIIIDVNDKADSFLKNNGLCLMTWGGDIPKVSENVYKYVRINTQDKLKTKTILLPGLGASWNTEAMMVGSTTIDSGWRMTPFVHNYDKLISAFEGNGLVRGKDFYVWNYDWRKPLSAIVADFDNFISGLNLGGDEKLNLVGHSLGGLVARLWTQDHGDMVNKTVTLGSPHYGSVKAYLAWNGLRFGDNSMANIALNVFLGLRSADGGVRVKNLRKFAPIVFDLNPTFSFLKKNGSVAVSPSSQYLKEMNGRDSLITPLLVTANGVGVETFSQVTLGDRTMFDKVLGVWEEGRPVAYEKSEGDGTVLKTSALIKGNKNIEIVSNHGDIVDKIINELMDEFGLNRPVALLKRGVVLAANPEMFIFFTDFKGEMKVICDGQEKSDVDGWVWFENVDREKCQAYFSGTANDNYKLIAGSGDEWQSLTGSLDNEGKSQLSISQESLSWKVLRQQADKLGAVNMFSEIDKKDILTTIDAYISFRTKSKNTKYSEDIIESLKILLKGQNKSGMEIDKQNLSAKNAKVMAETNLRLLVRKGVKPSYYSSLTYDQAEVLMTEGKNYAANYLAEKLYKIIWK